MADGWFPVLSPSGRRVMRGSEVLSLDDVTLPDQPKGGIAGAWLDENTIVYRTHLDPGELRRRTLTTGEDVLLAGPTSWVSAGGGVVAWCETPAGGATRIVAVSPGGRREWDGYGGGWAPVHVASNGWVFFGHHERGGLYWVPPGETTPVLLTALPARLVRSSLAGVTWEADGRVYVADWATLEPRDVTLPGEVEHGPVLVDTPAGPWLVTHTDRRLLARPLGRTTGVVLDESGDTYYPDAAWWPGDDARPEGVRVCWSQGLGPKGGSAGTPHDRVVPLDAPLVDLRPSAQWLPVGTQVDLMPFIAASYEGVLRCPEDGQTLQTVRLPDKVIVCLKGAPERQERWRYDDGSVYLTYDATDGREGRPWRIAPEPVWCRRLWPVGAAWHAPAGTRLVRRTLDGRSEAHPFPVRTRLHAAGEHVEVRGIGRCRVAVTTWEPGWPDSGYEERHWWAIRESDGLRLGRVRYEEWRAGVLERSFDFSELLPDVRIEPAPMLAIPDPVETPETPETPDTPERPERPDPHDMPEPTISDAEYLNAGGRIEHRYATWQRPGREVHTDPLSYRWMVDYYVLRRSGRDHEAAVREVERRMDVAAGVAAPEPEPVPPVTPPTNGLVGPLRVA